MRFTRRETLRGLAAGTAGAGLLTPPALAGTSQAPAASQPQGACVLFPQAVEGPFYFDPKLVRRDISDGQPGYPIDLTLRVIELGSCTPIAGARVDIWHADAGGVYSGYSGQGDRGDVSAKGKTHLRGTQMTDGSGNVTFRSVYPGWYPGRTPHIHVKVFLDSQTVLTGQVYFPDELSARIYKEKAPYASRPVADTTNTQDFIFRRSVKEGGGIVFAIDEASEILSAALVIAVDRTGPAPGRASGLRQFWRDLMGRE